MLPFYTVQQQTSAVIERFGKYSRITAPGLHFKIPIIERVAGRVSIRVQELNVKVKTKTKDNVFIDLLIAVQYYVDKNSIWDAFYKLSSPREQMESYIYDTVRAKVPTMNLDDVFEKKDDIAQDIENNLGNIMPEYGYYIKVALVNDIIPEPKVADAMNEINAQQRYQVAAEYKGEAEKILVIKQAEADARSKELSGQGVANQRRAIVEGLRESVENFKDSMGVSAEAVMSLVLLTQYYDMMTDVGKNSKNNTVMIPHTPGAVADLQTQIIAALKASQNT